MVQLVRVDWLGSHFIVISERPVEEGGEHFINVERTSKRKEMQVMDNSEFVVAGDQVYVVKPSIRAPEVTKIHIIVEFEDSKSR